MQDYWTLLVIPVIAIVIGLIIEYWVIQPLRKSREFSFPSSGRVSRDWSTAIKKAVQQFKAHQRDYIWSSKNEGVKIEDFVHVDRGRAALTIAVITRGELFLVPPGVIARYKLMIDRTGDILEINSISAGNAKIYAPTIGLPEFHPVIKNKKTIVQKTQKDTIVIIEFDIENEGKAGSICPYIEFQVVTTRDDGIYKPKRFNIKPKKVNIEARSIKPMHYTLPFPIPDLPLVESPHEVKIELRPCSDN